MKLSSNNLLKLFPSLLLGGLTLSFFWRVVIHSEVLLPADILCLLNPWHYYQGHRSVWNSLLSDPILQYYPWRHFLAESLKGGVLPLWNPYIFAGTPFLANPQSAVFYPLNVIFLLLPTPLAYTYQILLHIFLAGLFTYLYLRKLGTGQLAALVGGVVFMFSGVLVAWAEFATILSTAIWLPLLFLFVELAFRDGKIRYALLAGVVLATQIFAGHPQYAYYAIIALSLYLLFRLSYIMALNKRPKDMVRLILIASLPLIVGFALAAAQLLPTLELRQYISREHESKEWLAGGALPVEHLITFVVPDFWGNPIDNNYYGKGNYTEYAGYVGILPLFLATTALFARRDRYTLFFSILAIFSLALALATPLFKVMQVAVPMFSSFRAPQRFLYLYVFSMAILAGLGADYLINASRKRGVGIVFFGLLPAILVITGLMILEIAIVRGWLPLNPGSVRPYVVNKILLSLSFLMATITLLATLAKGVIRPNRFAILALTLLVVDLFSSGMRYNPSIDKRLAYFETESTRFLSADPSPYRIVRYGDELLSAPLASNTAMVYKIADSQGYDSFLPKRYLEFRNLIENDRGYAYWSGRIKNLSAYRSLTSPLLDLLNVKYVLSSQPLPTASVQHNPSDTATRETHSARKLGDRLQLVFAKEIYIYLNQNYFPRAFIVHHAEIIGDKPAILTRLTDPQFDPGQTVILEEEPPSRGDNEPFPGPDSMVQVITYNADRVYLEATAERSGLLILGDMYYPGWRAFVDGVETKIYRADYLLRAVYLEKGIHRVEFVFDPPSFKIGLTITGLTGILLLGPLLSSLWQGQRQDGLLDKGESFLPK
ncbi:MAG: YfhO family protein [Chloroflexi bacterium]|nr:YfhO family protein [Chloroflexota bacterium]MCL5075102.1 YfhO family protein [Chloroflexota bacterium]